LHTRRLVKPFDLEIPRKIRQPMPIMADTMNSNPGSSDALCEKRPFLLAYLDKARAFVL
jgi:hypothetical protein